MSTYSQAGQNFGLTLLWTLPLLIPVLVVNQEMVVRLGAVTGVGHARLINERFGKFWGAFSVGDLFILNFLTIATEFIGVSLALHYFGISQYLSVPIAAVLLIAMTATGSFRRWERFMFVFIIVNFLVVPLAFLSHPPAGSVLQGLRRPRESQGGFTSTSVLLIIAIVGTTVAPWQLFFQQSNIVDKRITPRWINYERADTVIGSLITVFAASIMMAVVASAFAGTPLPVTSPTPVGWPTDSSTTWAGPPGPSSPSSCSTPPSSGRPRSRWPPRTPSVTSSVPATPCTGAGGRPSSSTGPLPAWWCWPPAS